MPSLAQLATDWRIDPVPLALAALAAGAYLAAVRRARRPWPPRRTAAFLGGLAVLVACLESGLDAHSDELLSVHMLQHLGLTMLAAPLLVAGRPVSLALRALRGHARHALAQVVSSRPARVLANPLTGWTSFAAVILGTHLTPLYDLALEHAAVHELEHVAYLAAAALFWLPLLDADPVSSRRLGTLGRVVYLLAAMPVMAFVGVVVSSADHVLYVHYAATAPVFGVSALEDQRRAAAIMWVGAQLVMGVLLLVTAWASLEREERRALAREAREEERRAVGA